MQAILCISEQMEGECVCERSAKESRWIDIKGTLLGEKWWVDSKGDKWGEKRNVHGQTFKKKTSFVRPVFSRKISRIFQKPFYHAFITISEITTEMFANVFVALSLKVPHSCYSWAYSQPCLIIHMEYWEHSVWIAQFLKGE